MMSATEAFEGWLLKVEIVAGGACLLIFVVCLTAAVILIARSRKEDK